MIASASTGDDREIRCPRCGYDQRGVVATWKESCPLTGVCTECGLEFIWCEVLVPQKFEPRWCIEFEPRVRRLPWAAVKTFVRSLWPWGFWSRLQMSHRIRWLRLGVYAVLVPLLLLLPLYAIAQGLLALQVRAAMQQQLSAWSTGRSGAIQTLKAQKQVILANAGSGLSDTDVAMITKGIDAQIAQLQNTTTPYVDASALATTFEAIIFPLAKTSSASIVLGPGMTQPYVAPSQLIMWARNQSPYSSGALSDRATLIAAWLVWGVGMSALLPTSFVLLPFSLRRAKVRWTHVVRIVAYSVVVPVMWASSAVVVVWESRLVMAPATWMGAVETVSRYLPWLIVALWWHAAASRYLKIPHAWLTIGMLTLMNLLILLGVTAAISTELAWEMLDLFGPLIH